MNGKTCAQLNTELQGLAGDTAEWLKEDRPKRWGMEQGQFVNWIRPAGLPTFRKLYGKISADIVAGSEIRVNFISRHNVPGVTKNVLLGNVSWLGGKTTFSASFALIAS